MRTDWRARWPGRLLGAHSPSAHTLGRCWCHRGQPEEPVSREATLAVIVEAARRRGARWAVVQFAVLYAAPFALLALMFGASYPQAVAGGLLGGSLLRLGETL